MKTFTTAQKVRLWFALGCQLAGIIFAGTIPAWSKPGIVLNTQDGISREFWALAFLTAAGILVAISIYRFNRPANTQREDLLKEFQPPQPTDTER